MGDEERGEPISLEPHTTWYHGSPLRLEVLAAGSTVTPVRELAQAFSHKPAIVSIAVHDGDRGHSALIEHTGVLDGYLYHVQVEDAAADLRQHPGSRMAGGEEMLTARELPLQLLCFLPVTDERMEGAACASRPIAVRAVHRDALSARLGQPTGETE